MKIRITGSDDYSRLIKALIVGEPGSGKTLIASTFPKPFFVSAEGGLMSIAHKQIPFADVSSSDDLHKVKMLLENRVFAEANGLEIQTVVIDTIDEIQRILMSERMEAEKIDTFRIQDWGWLGEQMAAICRGFRNMPYHVVFTCHLKESKDDDTGSTYFRPALSGSIQEQLPGYVDLSMCIRVQQEVKVEDDRAVNVMKRKLITYPTKKFPFLKDRSGKLPKELDVDLANDFDTMNEIIYGDLNLPASTELDIDEKALTLGDAKGKEPEPVVTNEKTAEKVTAKASPKKSSAKKEEKAEGSSDEDEVLKCAGCGTEDLGGVDPDLSKILFREVLCRKHFDERKKKQSSEEDTSEDEND